MSDRFKFRGKRLDNNEWFFGSYLYLHNAPKYDWTGKKYETKEDVHYIVDENDVNYAVSLETIGQCTGLKDKNGKLIYDGDVVRENISGLYKIVYRRCAFYLENEDTICPIHELSMAFSEKKLEVIGNIYENKEL